jgi:hypothetical protein
MSHEPVHFNPNPFLFSTSYLQSYQVHKWPEDEGPEDVGEEALSEEASEEALSSQGRIILHPIQLPEGK